MSLFTEETQHYRHTIRFLAYYLWAQSNNDTFILELIKGDGLEALETAIREFIETKAQ